MNAQGLGRGKIILMLLQNEKRQDTIGAALQPDKQTNLGSTQDIHQEQELKESQKDTTACKKAEKPVAIVKPNSHLPNWGAS